MAMLGKNNFCQYILPVYCALLVVSGKFASVEGQWKGWDKELDWWQKNSIIYQIYPFSFQDSNGDGIGDIKGVQSRLDHLVEIGVKTFWMSPIFKSPMTDLGYDISNFTDIDPLFGTIEEFKDLVKAAKERGLHILLDFVPNHTSDEHEWFQKSLKKVDPYTDYYVWHDAKPLPDGNTTVPNNWLSLFGGTAWTWVEERKQYYYHCFSKKQPDLNYRNPAVRKEMMNVITFWLDHGVDGFRIDAVEHLFENKDFIDEVFKDPNGDKYDFWNRYHNITTHQPETYEMIFAWRKLMNDYAANASQKHSRFIAVEVSGEIHVVQKYFGNETHPGAQVPLNTYFFNLNYESNATLYKNFIDSWVSYISPNNWPNWVIGNHDLIRVATRVGENMVDAFAMMSMLLPGVSITYQGEEIGQPNTLIRKDQTKDNNNLGNGLIQIRDGQRGPFLWDSSENAGFTTRKKPWTPILPSFWRTNLEQQKQAEHSYFKNYLQLVKLKQHPTIQRGLLRTYAISTWVLAFVRELKGNDTFIVVMNVGSEREVIILGEDIPNIPETLTIILPSINSGYVNGSVISTQASVNNNSNLLVLRPKASVVLLAESKAPPTTNSPTATTTDSGHQQHQNSSASLVLSLPPKPLHLLFAIVLPIILNNR